MKHDYLTSRSFQSLTIYDLLEARSRHHRRLAVQFTNVVGTAVGFFRYRMREDAYKTAEAAYKRINQRLRPKAISRKIGNARTIENSAVRPWSPPCILVFVDSWLTREQFKSEPEKIIPAFLETDDARLVPTCVILAKQDEVAPDPSQHLNFPSHLLGGGYAAVADVQGKKHVSSIGCLVTDGDRTYALTNRHVTGSEKERVIASYVNQQRLRIGISCGKDVGRVPSSKVYSKWPGQESYSNVDAGLVLLDDVENWTTQVYGLGKLGEPFRINFDDALDTCIGLPVKAYGGASGPLSGEIVGLFYRYKALGGYDFVADFLIGARPNEAKGMRTLPGDSGTLWVVDQNEQNEPEAAKSAKKKAKVEKAAVTERTATKSYAPIGLQWGGHVTLGADGKQKFQFALSTSIESACRLLEVDVVRDWNIGHPEYWGEMGHYTIGLKACELISTKSPRLASLLSKNSANIGFDDTILKDVNKFHKKKAGYKDVPLADVADDIWRNPTQYGGRSGLANHPEKNNDGNNHFADMDQPGVGEFKDQTLMDLYKKSKDSLNIDTWSRFYELLSEEGEATNPGALPFRIWQGFNLMVKYLQEDKDVIGFLCVAGIMAHYVGDACQPLHISRLHHGDPQGDQSSVAKKVHSVYETTMLDNNAPAVLSGLKERLDQASAKATPDICCGQEAARRLVEMMMDVWNNLRPEKIIATYAGGKNDDERAQLLWDAHGEKTLDNMAECCTLLATLWESAWVVGKGETNIKAQDIKEFDYESELRPKFRPQSFYPSVELSLMKPYCT